MAIYNGVVMNESFEDEGRGKVDRLWWHKYGEGEMPKVKWCHGKMKTNLIVVE